MFKKENLDLIREKIKKDHLKGYLIVTGDPHASEYAGEYFLEERKNACPFSGSAGQVLITLNHAYLFCDGRYWLQAEKELASSSIDVMRVGDKDVLNFDEFINENHITPLGINTLMISENIFNKFINNGIEIKNVDYSLEHEKKLSKEKIYKIDEKLFSLSYLEKINQIEEKLKKNHAEANLVTTLDDIAWILNIRGNDIPCNPVFYSYLYISEKYGTHLFIDKDKIDFVIKNVVIHDYDEIYSFINEHKDVPTLLDPSKVNALIYSLFNKPINGRNPSYLMKAIKGDVEIENTKIIQAIDGIALLKFNKFLEENISNNLNEYEYSEKLKEFRYESDKLIELSFNTIAAVGKNAAEMHYSPTKQNNSIVSNNEIELLVDSGGQYYGGTTDTTRTFLIGEPTQEYKIDYTLTLKSLINLSRTIFLDGSTGQTIDIRAREFMWERGLDYKCGTGHGVSYMLNVHEGPNGFRYKKVPERDDQDKIVPGMITTIEPGVYKANKYGIRIENNLLCVNAFENENGTFYKFETITYVPVGVEALDLSLLNDEEIEWLNNYHQLVYDKLSILIDDPELLSYLKMKTKRISKN